MKRLQMGINFILNDLRERVKAVKRIDPTVVSVIHYDGILTEYYNYKGDLKYMTKPLCYRSIELPPLYQNKWELHQLNLGVI